MLLQSFAFRINFAAMFKHTLWATFTLVWLILSSACSTDLEVNAPYEETAVVYGLLDFNQPRQYIKVMKTFQNGTGNAFDYAKITDSLYFKDITVKLIKRSNGQAIVLQKDNSIPMKPGIFANDSNFIYYTDEKLNKGETYDLEVTDNISKKKFGGSTRLVDSVNWVNPYRSIIIPFEVKTTQFYSVIWETASQAFLYDLVLRIHYTDYNYNAQGQLIDSVNQVIDWPAATSVKTPTLAGGDRQFYSVKQPNLFSFLAANIPVKNNVKRRAYWVDFSLTGASEELSTYVQLNTPSFGVVQKTSQYTNITNGLGIFSSRCKSEVKNIPFSTFMQAEMAASPALKNLKFF